MLVMSDSYIDKELDEGQQWLEKLLNLAKIPAKVIAQKQEDSEKKMEKSECIYL